MGQLDRLLAESDRRGDCDGRERQADGNLTSETYGYSADGTVGTSWGNDITMVAAKPAYQTVEPVFVTATRVTFAPGVLREMSR